MPRKCGRQTTVDKERVFFEIVQHVDSHSDKQFNITVLGKMMEEKLSGNNVLYIWFKPIYFVDPFPCMYSNVNSGATNKWLFQQKIPRPKNLVFILKLL